jgi:hypothetical protein
VRAQLAERSQIVLLTRDPQNKVRCCPIACS